MAKKWYKDPFNWLVLAALALPIYFASYGILRGKVVGWVDSLINVGIPYSIVMGTVAGIQIFCMLAIPAIIVAAVVVAIMNWCKDKKRRRRLQVSHWGKLH